MTPFSIGLSIGIIVGCQLMVTNIDMTIGLIMGLSGMIITHIRAYNLYTGPNVTQSPLQSLYMHHAIMFAVVYSTTCPVNIIVGWILAIIGGLHHTAICGSLLRMMYVVVCEAICKRNLDPRVLLWLKHQAKKSPGVYTVDRYADYNFHEIVIGRNPRTNLPLFRIRDDRLAIDFLLSTRLSHLEALRPNAQPWVNFALIVINDLFDKDNETLGQWCPLPSLLIDRDRYSVTKHVLTLLSCNRDVQSVICDSYAQLSANAADDVIIARGSSHLIRLSYDPSSEFWEQSSGKLIMTSSLC